MRLSPGRFYSGVERQCLIKTESRWDLDDLRYARLMTERIENSSKRSKTVMIRKGSTQDIPAISSLVQEAYGQYVAAEGSEPAPMVADYRHLVDRDQVWVAELDSAVVGLLVLEDRSDYILLENIAVAAHLRGTGIGRKLLEFADTQTKGLGRREIRLYTGVVMTQNLHYYPRHGYVETHRDFEDGHHRVYFTKAIRPDESFVADEVE